MKKVVLLLTSTLLILGSLSLYACSSPDYSSQIASLEARIAGLESQNSTLTENVAELESLNSTLTEINDKLLKNQNNSLNEINSKLEETNRILAETTPEPLEYEKITLTKYNCLQYIAINVEFSDYNLIALEEFINKGEYLYTATVVVNITTSSRIPGLIFENVRIEYSPINTTTLWQTGTDTLKPRTNLDYKGNAKCSFVAIQEHSSVDVITPELFFYTENDISSISGYVLVPKAD